MVKLVKFLYNFFLFPKCLYNFTKKELKQAIFNWDTREGDDYHYVKLPLISLGLGIFWYLVSSLFYLDLSPRVSMTNFSAACLLAGGISGSYAFLLTYTKNLYFYFFGNPFKLDLGIFWTIHFALQIVILGLIVR